MQHALSSQKVLSNYLRFTNDVTDANKSVGKERIDFFYGHMLTLAGQHTKERTRYSSAKEDQRSYLLPPDYTQGGLISVRFKFNNQWYPLEEVHDLREWHQLTSVDRRSSVPSHIYVFNNFGNYHFEIDPIPDRDSSGSIELFYVGSQDRLLFPDDITDGTVAVESGNPTVILSSGTWDASIVNRFFRIDNGKYWYDINELVDSTHLKLVNNFQEATDASTNYEIVELLRLPEQFCVAPAYAATAEYYEVVNNDQRSQAFQKRYDQMVVLLESMRQRTESAVMPGITVGRTGHSAPRNYPNTKLTMI